MMLALCTAVTFRRPSRRAYSKAKRTIRVDLITEIGLIEIPESSRMRVPVISAINSIIRFASVVPCSNSTPA